jgi:hypothetical protein
MSLAKNLGGSGLRKNFREGAKLFLEFNCRFVKILRGPKIFLKMAFFSQKSLQICHFRWGRNILSPPPAPKLMYGHMVY